MTDHQELATRCRLRAEEVRSIAEHVKREETRAMLEAAARDYERMALMYEVGVPNPHAELDVEADTERA
jgi:hypothetical protein